MLSPPWVLGLGGLCHQGWPPRAAAAPPCCRARAPWLRPPIAGGAWGGAARIPAAMQGRQRACVAHPRLAARAVGPGWALQHFTASLCRASRRAPACCRPAAQSPAGCTVATPHTAPPVCSPPSPARRTAAAHGVWRSAAQSAHADACARGSPQGRAAAPTHRRAVGPMKRGTFLVRDPLAGPRTQDTHDPAVRFDPARQTGAYVENQRVFTVDHALTA